MNSRNINYLSKDFGKFKQELLELAKNYFPDTYTDFSATSPGTMFMEMAAYVGDILSFYQDSQIQETYLEYAKNPSSLYAIAYMMGYRPKVSTAAETELTIMQTIGASGSLYEPDWNQTCRVLEYSSVKSNLRSEDSFLLRDTVDFSYSSSYDPTEVRVADWDDFGNPRTYELVKKVKCFSGKVKQVTKKVGTYQKYLTFELEDANILGVLDIVDSNGNRWEEVPFLGQDTIFEDEVDESGTPVLPYVLRLKKVPRRFVTRFTAKGKLQIQFGAGMIADDNDELNFFPNPISLAPSVQETSSDRFDVAYDPSNFLFSKSYGLAPVNTTLTIRYIVGGGVQSNVPSNSLTKPNELNISGKDSRVKVDPTTIRFFNEYAATGGRDGDTIEEIRQNALRSFAEQKRTVTLNDFNVRALSMPPKYGVISKAYAVNESLSDISRSSLFRNPLAVTLYVLAEDIQGKLTEASDILKTNLKTYLSNYIMLTDAVEIKDAFVVNIGVQYEIVLRPNYLSNDVLIKCNKALADFFSTDKRHINEVIYLSDAYALLDRIEGVQTVKSISIINKVGEEKGYSKYAYDVASALREKVLYPSLDPCIFEVKYPNIDIEGRIVTM